MESIFVSIASYKDPEVFPTVIDLFEKAKNPDKVFVGVMLQDEVNVINNFNNIYSDYNVRLLYVSPKQAQGCGWARNEIMKHLYNKEDYFLLVDSHTRFAVNWDEHYIEMLKDTPSKCVLSAFPRHYELNESYEEYSLRDLCSIYIPNDIPFVGDFYGPHQQKLATKKNEKLMNISGGNMFGPGSIVDAITVDLYNYYGDCEQELYSLLLYQCGYDIYAPSKNLIWHKYFVIGKDNYREIYKEKNKKVNFWPNAININCSLRSSDKWLEEYKVFIKDHRKIS